MASILLLSEKGRILPIGGKLKNEGHIVKVWIKQGSEGVLKGEKNPSRVQSYGKMLEQYDLVLSESTLVKETEEIRGQGKQVMGCNAVMGKLILDLEYQEKVLSFLLKKREALEGTSCRLTGWVGEKGFSPLVLVSFPSYRMLYGDKGVKTEGMGSLVAFLPGDTRLNRLLVPFEEFLLKAEYIGPFSCQLSVKGDLWNIDHVDTCFIPEDILAGAELLRSSLFDFLYALLTQGKDALAWDGLGLSCTLSVPPWPYLGAPLKTGYLNVPEVARKHFSMGAWELGVLGVASARGEDVREARRRVYRTITNSIVSKDVQYRDDIGLDAEKDFTSLREWGWLV